MTKAQKSLTAAQIVSLLERKYSSAAWAFFAEVSNATGSYVCNRADGLAISLWPSRGLHFHGFEVKVSRRDWLNELKRPRKAETIGKFCHFWWLVIGDESIVADGELPSGWGLQLVRKTKLIVLKEAPMLEPQPPTHGFVAAVLRKYADAMIPRATLTEQLEHERKELIQQAQSSTKFEVEQLKKGRANLRKSIAEFESASGISIDGYDSGRIAKAVAVIADAQSFGIQTDYLVRARNQLLTQLQRMNEAITEMENCDYAKPSEA